MGFKEDDVLAELAGVRGAGRWRAVRAGGAGLCFSSNDYLNLARDPRVVAAGQAALAAFGAGAGASRLMAGEVAVHARLEIGLSSFFGMEAALVFPSGYQANVGTITALAGRDAIIFSDALNHASLIDGARLSRSEVRVYPHNDIAALGTMLAEATSARRKLIVTESIFSMDGDRAPVSALAALAERHGAWLVVDEAHAIGVLGAGRGLCALEGVRADVVLGTLSKALGSQGGFVACSPPVRDLVVNKARTFIFSTGLSPACAAAALAALEIVVETPAMGERLLARAGVFRAALREQGLAVSGSPNEVKIPPNPPSKRGEPDSLAMGGAAGFPLVDEGNITVSESQIIPILLGDEGVAMRAAAGCRARGVEAHGIRPPTVPVGQCRLRLSVTLAHSEEELVRAAGLIAEAVREARA